MNLPDDPGELINNMGKTMAKLYTYEQALIAIMGPFDHPYSDWRMRVYIDANGGYDGLQEIASEALRLGKAIDAYAEREKRVTP